MHYNEHRPHRARKLHAANGTETAADVIADLAAPKILRRKVLGGLIIEYEQAA